MSDILPFRNYELRDLFAMAAVIGLMAEPLTEDESMLVNLAGDIDEHEGRAEAQLSAAAYALADAMMQRRKSK